MKFNISWNVWNELSQKLKNLSKNFPVFYHEPNKEHPQALMDFAPYPYQ